MSKILHIVIARAYTEETSALCDILTTADDIVALHIDLKNTSDSIPEAILLNPNVILTAPRISVFHGDFSIVEAILHSYNHCKTILESTDYVNIISGQDYPTRPMADLHNFIDANHGKIFLNYNKLPILDGTYHQGSANSDFTQNCIWPFGDLPKYYFDRINPDNYLGEDSNFNILKLRSYRFEKRPRIAAFLTSIQKFRMFNRLVSSIRRFRSFPQSQMYAGSAWCLLTVAAMDEVTRFLQSRENNNLKRFFEKMKYPDEFVFQTILVNSGKFDIVNSDLHYINWNKADGYGRPALIDLTDIELIAASNAFFCRKVNPEIIQIINRELIDKAK